MVVDQPASSGGKVHSSYIVDFGTSLVCRCAMHIISLCLHTQANCSSDLVTMDLRPAELEGEGRRGNCDHHPAGGIIAGRYDPCSTRVIRECAAVVNDVRPLSNVHTCCEIYGGYPAKTSCIVIRLHPHIIALNLQCRFHISHVDIVNNRVMGSSTAVPNVRYTAVGGDGEVVKGGKAIV